MRFQSIFAKINPKHLLLAIFLSLFLSLFAYLLFLQSPLLSKREFAFTLLLWIVFTPFLYLLLTSFLIPRLDSFPFREKHNWLLISFSVGILFALVSRPPQLILLYPKHTLQVIVPPGATNRSITLDHITSSLIGDISFSQFITAGNWNRVDSNLQFIGPDQGSLTWSGITGESVSLVFNDSPALKDIRVGWDGLLTPLDMSNVDAGNISLISSFVIPWQSDFVARFITGFTFALLFLILTLFFAGPEPIPVKLVPHKKGYWLLYTLPMIAVWMFFLLIFFPGLMTQDTTIQWEQVITGQYSDAHPIFFALLVKALSAMYNSPAVVVLAQVLMLSLSLAWGMSELERMGCPRIVLWILSVLCAILPINILGSLVLRKDIPFSTSVLLLSIVLLKIVNTEGEWLKKRWNWLGLGLILGTISLSRINGLPISIGSLLLILFFYRPVWRRMAAAAGVFLLMLLMMYGPIYSNLKVKHVPEFGTVLFLHHIAAHLAAGTPLDGDQAEYLAKLAPLNGWNYDCCTSNPTALAIFPGALVQNFDLPLIKQDVQRPTRIALNLFLKDPKVDIRHMICAGQIVWSLDSACPDRINVRLQPLESTENPVDSYFIGANQMGFTAAPFLPELIQYANPYLQVYSKGLLHWINFTPAFYLYLAIYCTCLFAFRRKKGRLLIFLAPVLLQSLTLLLITISQAYRYQYSVVLVGLLSVGLLFIPKRNSALDLGKEETDIFS